jgi:hypothetical protein
MAKNIKIFVLLNVRLYNAGINFPDRQIVIWYKLEPELKSEDNPIIPYTLSLGSVASLARLFCNSCGSVEALVFRSLLFILKATDIAVYSRPQFLRSHRLQS